MSGRVRRRSSVDTEEERQRPDVDEADRTREITQEVEEELQKMDRTEELEQLEQDFQEVRNCY